ALVHDTLVRSAGVPCGLPIFSSDQLLPFQRSARPTPVAMHVVADGQDTASSSLLLLAAGLGVFWMTHFLPFHSSASVLLTSLESLELPTAKQLVAEAQDRPVSLLIGLPDGFGVARTFQFLPFHSSLSGDSVAPFSVSPTARQLFADVQTTVSSELICTPPGAGAVWIVHDVPFQRSASGTAPEPFGDSPTAVQADALVHQTPNSWLLSAGWAMIWLDQPAGVRLSTSSPPVEADTMPTAMQVLGAVQETAFSPHASTPPIAGVSCCAQLASAAGAVISSPEATTVPARASFISRRCLAGTKINSQRRFNLGGYARGRKGCTTSERCDAWGGS